MKLASCAVVLVLGLAACGEEDEPSLGASAPKTTLVAALGDSITEGAPQPDRWYGYWAERRLKAPGSATAGSRGRRRRRSRRGWTGAREGADVLIVQGGINDIAQGRPVEEAARNLRAMAERGRRLKLRVALAEVLPWNNGFPGAVRPVKRLNRLIARIGRDLGVPVYPWYAKLDDPANPGRMKAEWTSDGTTRRSRGIGAWRRPCGFPARVEHRVDHRLGQLPGERVLLAGVEAAEQQRSVLDRDARRRGRTSAAASPPSSRQAASQANAPRHTITRGSSSVELLARVGEAVVALLRQRLVRRRRAAHRGGDEGVVQPQAVVAPTRLGWLANPVRCIEREQPVARAIAGEHPAGAVRAVRGRGEAEHVDRAPGSPKPGTGRPQYSSSRERRPLLARHLLAPLDEARAARGRPV